MNVKKGIILAGGKGTRLGPLTSIQSKQLLPVYDKPMVYYPLSVLMLANIREILLISTGEHINYYYQLLGTGEELGLKITYAIQPEAGGIAQAFLIGEEFIGDDPVALILGDNIFFGHSFQPILEEKAEMNVGATLFGYQVNNPQDFGVIEFDDQMVIRSLEEKPRHPKSQYIATGLYFYDNRVVSYAKTLVPSSRGELEITDINKLYIESNSLRAELLGRGFSWWDTGTIENLNDACHFIGSVQRRQKYIIACIEEISWRKGWIDTNTLIRLGNRYSKSEYGQYIINLAKEIK